MPSEHPLAWRFLFHAAIDESMACRREERSYDPERIEARAHEYAAAERDHRERAEDDDNFLPGGHALPFFFHSTTSRSFARRIIPIRRGVSSSR